MQPRFKKDPCAERLRELVATEVASQRLLDRAYLRLHAKAVGVLLWALVSYWVLVIVTPWWWPVCFLSFVLAITAVAFNLMHDGNHQAFSRNGRTNRLAGLTLDLLGVSSLFWVEDHNRKHHSAPNVDPFDGDIDYGFLARVAPSKPWRPWYRFQHYYLWFLYIFLLERWQFYLDVRKVLGRRTTSDSPATGNRSRYWVLFAGKLLFLGWAFALPAVFHPLWAVALLYFAGAGLAGLILATVLQWAHCVEGAMFLSVQHRQERLPETWLRIQVEATRNVHLPRWLSWYVGGLDHQIEHHLFTRYPHTIYPRLARTVEDFCRANRIEYRRHRSLWAAIRAHYMWLRQMGQRPSPEGTTERPNPSLHVGPRRPATEQMSATTRSARRAEGGETSDPDKGLALLCGTPRTGGGSRHCSPHETRS
jgi:linoleoyl-CoA desaturase